MTLYLQQREQVAVGILLILVLGGMGLGLWFRYRAQGFAGKAPRAEAEWVVDKGETVRVGGTIPDPAVGGSALSQVSAAGDTIGSTGASQSQASEPDVLMVHVAGAVKEPGVHAVKRGGRVADAVAAAGGATDQARLDVLNLASRLDDGQKIYVPSQADVLAREKGGVQDSLWSGYTGDEGFTGGPGQPRRLNVNQADARALEGLPGIGPALAARIVDYRRRHGPFHRPEDLQNVAGIGPAKFDEMRDHIAVN